MKKFNLFILLFISSASIAQTIDQTDLPFAGFGSISGVDTNYSAAIPPGGMGQNWNYAALQTDIVDTTGFGVSAGTPFASSFPSANLASHKISTDEWSYFTAGATGFYINGFVSNATPYVLNPPQLYVPVPFSYGNTHTDISRIVIDTTFLTYAAQAILNFHSDFIADGTGSLTTPIATYPSTLRVKQTMLETDSLLVDYLNNGNYVYVGSQQSQKTYYRWFRHGGTANYLLGIDADSLGTMGTRSDFLMAWAVVGIEEEALMQELSLFPIPASGELQLKSEIRGITSLRIFNSAGIEVSAFEDLPSDMSHFRIDVSGLPDGLYFYDAAAGSRSFRGKFTVVR